MALGVVTILFGLVVVALLLFKAIGLACP